MDLKLRHLMTVELDGVLPPNELGETPFGRRRIVGIAGGRFTGERLSGKVLPVGGDWALIRRDGVFNIDVRALLEADDGTLISFNYTGRWHASPEEMARLLRREGDLATGDYYYRVNAVFECATSSRYNWLNNIVTVASGRPKIFGSIYDVHEVL
ncbi:MAG: DUF3237 domain-containing protein [Rhodospirillaceae bacterium]|nr:DUF3237 domain-containing protein [Rhodospirillaceae bacterium]